MSLRASPPLQSGDLVVFRAPLDRQYPGLVRVQAVQAPLRLGDAQTVVVTWGGVRLPGAYAAAQLRRVAITGKRRPPHEIHRLLAPRLLQGQGWQVGEWVWLWVPDFGVLIDGVLAQVTQVKRNRAWVDLLPGVRFAPDGRSSGRQGLITPLEVQTTYVLARSVREEQADLARAQGRPAALRAHDLLKNRSHERATLLRDVWADAVNSLPPSAS
ncbi:hypothetical protein [Deinococcus multiflagellatus]|uniref:Primosomal protein N' 3' DNA-binding domain-containing protein n=1 Tax=Deinococcus multiflagellatus TaxID=1656887 RepID=A0ABW1ZNR5_9DEIO|nr:hypothetical protein [Deinococcus multiflagellatus]MBZ9714919.1 hypothetical protein [Deinococcus multiflagellatus]